MQNNWLRKKVAFQKTVEWQSFDMEIKGYHRVITVKPSFNQEKNASEIMRESRSPFGNESPRHSFRPPLPEHRLFHEESYKKESCCSSAWIVTQHKEKTVLCELRVQYHALKRI